MKISILLLVLTTNIYAASFSDLVGGDFDSDSREERVEIANSIFEEIQKIDNYVPNIKPSEQEWLNQEQLDIQRLEGKEGYYERIKQLASSVERAHIQLKNLIESIKSGLECILAEHVKFKSEIGCWAFVALKLNDRSTWSEITILIRHDRLPKDIEDKTILSDVVYESDYGYLLSSIADGILEYIVLDYLVKNQ